MNATRLFLSSALMGLLGAQGHAAWADNPPGPEMQTQSALPAAMAGQTNAVANQTPNQVTSPAMNSAMSPAMNPAYLPGQTSSPVFLTVNGRPIPKSRADALAATMPPPRNPQEAEAMRRGMADDLVQRELAAQEGAKRGLDNRPDVRSQIDLAAQGIIAGAYLADYVRANPISEDAIRREYDQMRAAQGSREYKIRHILVATEPEANAIIEKLNTGGNFAQLAQQSLDRASKDQGGDLGWSVATRYAKPFAESFMNLPRGSLVAKPVPSEAGWHVVALDDVRDLPAPSLAEMRPQILQRLQQQMVARHLAELRSRARVE